METLIGINVEEEKVSEQMIFSKDYLTEKEGQIQIIDFTEKIKSELGSKKGWKDTCIKADNENFLLNDEKMSEIISVFEPYIKLMPPGHDPGHFKRDLIHGIIIGDSIKNEDIAYSKSDYISGILAGAFHDIGTSIIPRYEDKKLGAGHAEVGAWLFDKLTKDILPENLRKLAVYSICAHTSIQKEISVQVPNNYIKKPYFNDLWKEDDKLLGLGYITTRMADRLDNNGLVLCLRHMMSHFDPKEEGNSDISGDQWFEINEESLSLILKTETKKIDSEVSPTTLEHVLNYEESNFGNSVHSKDDDKFPDKFQEILNFEINSFHQMIDLMNKGSEISIMKLDNIRNLFLNITQTSEELFEPVWNVFKSYWNRLETKEKGKWSIGFNFMKKAYKNQLNLYKSNITNSSFPRTLEKIIAELERK